MNRTQVCAERTTIRQASSADIAAIAAFLGGLSLRTRYLRFFTGAPSWSGAMLRKMAGGGDNIDVVVATADGAVVGHAMAVDVAGPGGAVADIGVVVTDAWQGCGLGTALVAALTARAQRRGVTGVGMDVLADNKQVFRMIGKRWPGAAYKGSGITVAVRAALRESPSPARAAAMPVARSQHAARLRRHDQPTAGAALRSQAAAGAHGVRVSAPNR